MSSFLFNLKRKQKVEFHFYHNINTIEILAKSVQGNVKGQGGMKNIITRAPKHVKYCLV
jgi:hypothetical protein